MSDLVKKEILESPQKYYDTQNSLLKQKLNKIKLSNQQEQEIIKNKTIKTIRDKFLGLFKLGDLVTTILDWNEDIDHELREAKKEILLSTYFHKVEQNEESVNKILELLSNQQGNTLFNKIVRILDNNPPDIDMINYLSNSLKNIINSEFVLLFEDHKYALSQIDLLAPQSLTILSDNQNWPIIKQPVMTITAGRIDPNLWLDNFTNEYCRIKGITEDRLIKRVLDSVNDLINKRFMVAQFGENRTLNINVSANGKVLLPYIS